MTMQVDDRWAAVQARNASANGRFVYSVRTTGVYCRPSCPSRAASRENVAFHADCAAAEAAGFRACRRCDPRGQNAMAGRIVACCRAIEAAESPPGLAELAASAGLSPAHFHRVFKAQTGLTPRGYAAFCRAERVRTGLAQGGSVTTALYDAGYNAASRFYAEAGAVLGMRPETARKAGNGEAIGYAIGSTRLGAVLVAVTGRGVCHIALGDEPEALVDELERRFTRARIAESGAFGATLAQVIALVETGSQAGSPLPLDIRGTAFQQKVWQALLRIEIGQTSSYAAIAAEIGQPGAARAVARACAANTIAVAVPCHRVVRGDGGVAGYRWGVARKRALLETEGEGTAPDPLSKARTGVTDAAPRTRIRPAPAPPT